MLERINTEIHRVWGPVSHLNSVVSSPALRDAFNRCLPLITEFGTELGQNETLYGCYGALEEARLGRASRSRRSSSHRRCANFGLAGVDLAGEERQRFRDIMQTLAAHQATLRAEPHGRDRRVPASRAGPRRARRPAARWCSIAQRRSPPSAASRAAC